MARHIQFMHELNSRILFHSSFSHILFLPALPHPNIICKAFRAFHPVCFHCVPSDESQVPDSHLFSFAKRSVAPLFYEYNLPFSGTSESFPKLPGKIHTAQGADKYWHYCKEHSPYTNTNLDVQSYVVYNKEAFTEDLNTSEAIIPIADILNLWP